MYELLWNFNQYWTLISERKCIVKLEAQTLSKAHQISLNFLFVGALELIDFFTEVNLVFSKFNNISLEKMKDDLSYVQKAMNRKIDSKLTISSSHEMPSTHGSIHMLLCGRRFHTQSSHSFTMETSWNSVWIYMFSNTLILFKNKTLKVFVLAIDRILYLKDTLSKSLSWDRAKNSICWFR